MLDGSNMSTDCLQTYKMFCVNGEKQNMMQEMIWNHLTFSLACINRGSSTNLHAVHRHGDQVVGVLLVPAEPEQRVVLGVFIDDSAVFEVPEVKHADRAVRSHWGEHVPTTARSAERDVIHLQRNQTVISSGEHLTWKIGNLLQDYLSTILLKTIQFFLIHLLPLCHEQWAASWHDPKLSWPCPAPAPSPAPRLYRLCRYWTSLHKKDT